MPKPHGRKTRQLVKELLGSPDRGYSLDRLARIPDKQLAGHLFSHFYDRDELIRFRSVSAMGCLGGRLADRRMERARDLMRRFMWNLNDESGGIGWGSAEAMGEVMSQSPDLAAEFDSILFSYLNPKANYIDNPLLQRGILWGIGTYVNTSPDRLPPDLAGLILPFLEADDPVKKGYAVRALSCACRLDNPSPSQTGHIQADTREVRLYDGWHFKPARICDLV